ncbi:MAG: hypothetical protein JPMHGGIA_02126 [Saprospiraceae bacterium]|jgi:hypothetical protein|nr:hypothetical protein [Saprospiraceae bacterium]
MPKRAFKSVEEFEGHVKEAKEIIIDGTENATERPKGNENQKVKYSGKKSTHTDIALLISDKERKIYYVSRLYDGSNVDFGILKSEFPPGHDWFRNIRLLVDLGFVGIDKIYTIKELVIGKKRTRKSNANPNPQLTDEQKELNKKVSRERIFVEHAIGGMKIFRNLKNRCRLKITELKDMILGICAGLWNFHLVTKC